jgi:hypothetical protein
MRTTLAAVSAIAACVIFLAGCSREKLGPLPEGTHRRASTTIAYYLDEAASESLELGVRESFQLWGDATAFRFSYGGKAKARIGRDGRNMVILARKWPNELPIGEVAWCQAYLDGSGSIVEADILLNAQAYSFTTRREARPGSLYIEDVLGREIGRSLGLGLGAGGEAASSYRKASAGDDFEPGIDPAEMAAYLSLYGAGR